MRFDVLRAQRFAAAVTVYIEQFSAHPLERDAAERYASLDGYLDADGKFSPERKSSTDVPVYEVLLKPEDGLYALPYRSTSTCKSCGHCSTTSASPCTAATTTSPTPACS